MPAERAAVFYASVMGTAKKKRDALVFRAQR
jgi:hypothetical protein